MFQTHPLNANDKILRRFYEPLVLLSVLDPTGGAHRPDLILDRGLDEKSKLWRNYVDQLSWLCDLEKGGDTVVAVAAKETNEAPIFWLASNSNSRKKARDHLIWIFGRLGCLYAASPMSTTQLEDEITARCIDFSPNRIKTYTAWLLQAFREAKRMVRGFMSDEDEVLFKGLEQFEGLVTNFHLLCAFAHSFRGSESMQILCKRHNGHSSRGVWSDMRHCIGRLGSWTKATRILILGAQAFPRRIENAQVEVIEPNGPADLPNKTHMTDLQGVVHRMLPADQNALVEELSQALTDANALAQIESRFREDYSNIKPRPHAELLVLEHFHRNTFDFVADDKYIGCSKPSCYCCHLYLQRHPGRFMPRPSHGNLWINWAPPIPLPVVTDATGPGGVRTRPQEHHTFQMLQEMVAIIRQDLQDQILSRRPRRERLPDSTTGISSVVLDMDASGTALDHIAANTIERNNIYQARVSTTLASVETIEPNSDLIEDATSESYSQDAKGDLDDRLSTNENISTKRKRSGKSKHDNYEDDEESPRLMGTGIRGEHCAPGKQTNSSDDDDDGGVLLFRGRHSYPSQNREYGCD